MKRVCQYFQIVLFGLLLLPIFTGCASARPSNQAPAPIYDPRASGEQQLAGALMVAQREHKRVLLNLGADWCSDSRATHHLLTTDPDIRRELREHFVLVFVDVNQRDGAERNADLVARLGNPLTRGIPVLLIVAPDGSVLNTDPAERLSDDAHTEPARVLAYLRKWRES